MAGSLSLPCKLVNDFPLYLLLGKFLFLIVSSFLFLSKTNRFDNRFSFDLILVSLFLMRDFVALISDELISLFFSATFLSLLVFLLTLRNSLLTFCFLI